MSDQRPPPAEATKHAESHQTSSTAKGRKPYSEDDSTQDVVAVEDRVPMKQIIALGVGSIPNQYGSAYINKLTMPIMNITFGIDPEKISNSVMLTKFVDGAVDPLIGWFSDKFDSKWGRRKPLMMLGAILMAFTTLFIWFMPINGSPSTIMTWFLVVMVLYKISSSLYYTPFYALSIEVTPDYKERTRVNAIRSYFQYICGLGIALMMAFVLWEGWNEIFETDDKGPVYAARILGVFIAVLTITCCMAPILFVKERYLEVARKVNKKKGFNVFQAIAATFNNRPFLHYFFASVAIGGGLELISGIGMYINIYYVSAGNISKGGMFQTIVEIVGFSSAIAGVTLMKYMCDRLGKHKAAVYALTLMGFGGILKWWAITPEHPYLQLLITPFFSIGISTFYVVFGSLLPDIIDYDEYLTGQRREGFFASVASFVGMLMGALATGASGRLLNMTGFDIALKANQAPEAIINMRLLDAFLPAFFCFFAIVCMITYPLNKRKMLEIRSSLEQRRGKV